MLSGATVVVYSHTYLSSLVFVYYVVFPHVADFFSALPIVCRLIINYCIRKYLMLISYHSAHLTRGLCYMATVILFCIRFSSCKSFLPCLLNPYGIWWFRKLNFQSRIICVFSRVRAPNAITLSKRHSLAI